MDNDINKAPQIDEYFKELDAKCDKLSEILSDSSVNKEYIKARELESLAQQSCSDNHEALKAMTLASSIRRQSGLDNPEALKTVAIASSFNRQTNYDKSKLAESIAPAVSFYQLSDIEIFDTFFKYIDSINRAINLFSDINFEPILATDSIIDELIQKLNECFDESSPDDEDTDTPIEISEADKEKFENIYNKFFNIINRIKDCKNNIKFFFKKIDFNAVIKAGKKSLKIINAIYCLMRFFNEGVITCENIHKIPTMIEYSEPESITSPSSIELDSPSPAIDKNEDL